VIWLPRQALVRIWHGGVSKSASRLEAPREARRTSPRKSREALDYGEAHHTKGKPREVVELYRALDRFCQDLSPGQVTRRHLAKYVSWSQGKWIFCSAHLQQSGMRVWVKLDPKEIPESAVYARDVSAIGHWGVGDVELAVDGMDRLRDAEQFIQAAYEAEPRN